MKGVPSRCLAIDINPIAAQTARQTALLNGVQIDVLCGDLLTCFQSDAAPTIDVVLFNPPYVPTDAEEMNEAFQLALKTATSMTLDRTDELTGLLTLAWAGGEDGRGVLDRFLLQVFAMVCASQCVLSDFSLSLCSDISQ